MPIPSGSQVGSYVVHEDKSYYGYHWCNDHAAHVTDPYKHRHAWEYIGIHPMNGDALFKCKYGDLAVRRVTPERFDGQTG